MKVMCDLRSEFPIVDILLYRVAIFCDICQSQISKGRLGVTLRENITWMFWPAFVEN